MQDVVLGELEETRGNCGTWGELGEGSLCSSPLTCGQWDPRPCGCLRAWIMPNPMCAVLFPSIPACGEV